MTRPAARGAIHPHRILARAILATCLLLAAGISGCAKLLPVAEGEYHFLSQGTPSGFQEGFEENDGLSSTLNYIKRIANDKKEKPSVSRDWAYEGGWSMGLPPDSSISFHLTPAEPGILSYMMSGDDPGYITLGDGTYNYFDPDTDPNVAQASFILGADQPYMVGIPNPSGKTLYVDEIRFTPLLSEASPTDGTLSDKSPKLDWAEVSDGLPYRLQLSLSADFSSTLLDARDIRASEYQLSGLEQGRCYYWRIQASIDDQPSVWSASKYFFVPGPATDDSFETSLDGLAALNAWCGKGYVKPRIVSTDASAGTRSVRFDPPATTDMENSLQMAIVLDSPKVMYYSYKIVGQTDLTNPALYLQTTVSGYMYGVPKQFMTGGSWKRASISLKPGESLIKWKFGRIAADSFSEAYLLIDDIQFDDPPDFEGDDFEAVDASGNTKAKWGYGGWAAPTLRENGGVNDSRCLYIPAEFSYEFQQSQSRICQVADLGEEPSILAFKAKTSGLAVSAAVDGTPHYPGYNPYRPEAWNDYFFMLNDTGTHTLDIVNRGNASMYIDDVRLKRYAEADDFASTVTFEDGRLLDNSFWNDGSPPSISTECAHSGTHSLKLGKSQAPGRTYFSLPLKVPAPITVTCWIRCIGTKTPGDALSLGYDELGNSISSTWTQHSVNLSTINPYFMLQWSFSYSGNEDFAIFIDDISIAPR
ncbi:MAG TPA: hypothetical protein VN445_00420 [Rectinemataceae bacterium]|nr:hypothetical protein [Rectinemataceae bacterium]